MNSPCECAPVRKEKRTHLGNALLYENKPTYGMRSLPKKVHRYCPGRREGQELKVSIRLPKDS